MLLQGVFCPLWHPKRYIKSEPSYRSGTNQASRARGREQWASKTRKYFSVRCCARISTDDFQQTFRNPALGSSNGENNARKTFFLPNPVPIRPGANLFISSDGRSARLIARPSISENRRPVSPRLTDSSCLPKPRADVLPYFNL